MSKAEIFSSFKASLPAFFGYVSLGISFGFLFEEAGAVWYLAPLMSLLVYAGAAQFVAVSLLVNHASLLQILSATFFINLRHIFYGISFLGKFPNKFFKKMYMIFGLTDESYSILTSLPEKYSEKFSFYVILFSHAYWVIGSLLGALLGMWVSVDLKFLGFTLVELFVILTIEQIYVVRNAWPFIMALLFSLVAMLIWPSQMLVLAISLCTLAVASVYMIKEKRARMAVVEEET